MLDHHIQRQIVYRLAFAPSLRFSELQPEGLENKLFNYHLKKSISAGYVARNQDGSYELTPEGRRLGERSLSKQLEIADNAESILILAIRRQSDKAWLLYRRKTHPLLGKVGFMHAIPRSGATVAEHARQVCLTETGLQADFRVLGAGFFETYDGDELESYVNFTFLVSDNAIGKLEQHNDFAEYFWVDDPDFSDATMVPNMKTLGNLHKVNELFYVERKFTQ